MYSATNQRPYLDTKVHITKILDSTSAYTYIHTYTYTVHNFIIVVPAEYVSSRGFYFIIRASLKLTIPNF